MEIKKEEIEELLTQVMYLAGKAAEEGKVWFSLGFKGWGYLVRTNHRGGEGMKNYIILNYFGTFIVAAKDRDGMCGTVAECRSVEQARVVKAALEAKESK